MSTMEFDPISVVEAAYRLDADPDQWLAGISERAAPFFPGRDRMMSLIIESDQEVRTRRTYSESEANDAEAVERVFSGLDRLPPELQQLYARGFTELTSLSSVLGGAPRAYDHFRQMTPDEVEDYVGIMTRDPSGFSIQIGAIMDEPTEVDATDIPLWTHIGAHVATGFRLRRRLDDLSLEGADAVIDPGGKLEHAGSEREKSPAFRQALCEAAVNIDRVRTDLRATDARRGLELWKGLVRGTYSLVETFDTDGRRFYVARRNDPQVDNPEGLSRRERQVVAFAALGYDNRRIAYQLGLAPSTVGTYLKRAMDKLRVDSRVELVQLVQNLAESPS